MSDDVVVTAIRQSLQQGLELHGKPGVFACHYSGMWLATNRSQSVRGDYASYDHVVPGDATHVVICSRAINHIKGPLTDVEFDEYIRSTAETLLLKSRHGLSDEQFGRFMTMLDLARRGPPPWRPHARDVLKQLAFQVRYEHESVTLSKARRIRDRLLPTKKPATS